MPGRVEHHTYPVCRFKLFLVVCLLQAVLLSIFAWFHNYEPSVTCIRRSPKLPLELQQASLQLSSTRTTLFVAVLTHSKRKERRDAIRETWMILCKENPKDILCRFFTDEVGLSDDARTTLQHEKQDYHDIEILNATGEYTL